MKRSAVSSTEAAFALLLAFLFLIDVSIAACYVLGTILLAWFLLHLARGGPFPRLPAHDAAWAAYIVFTLLATAFSIDRAASIRDNKELLIFLLIPIFHWLLDSRRRVRLSLAAVLASALLSSLAGLFAVWRKGIVLNDRLTGFTSHWMTYSGLLMLPFIFFSVLLFLRRGDRRETAAVSLVLAAMLAAIAFSLTRNVWLGIACALGLFVAFFRPKLLLGLAPLALAAVLLAPAAVKSRVLSIVDLQDRSNRDRFYMAWSGWRLFQDRPWTGVGSNNIGKAIRADEGRYRHPQAEKINMHLHNNFLQILAERGLLALASFLLACAFILAGLLRRLRRGGGEARALAAGVLFAFVGFLVAGLFEYNFGDSEIKFLLFYFLSLPFLTLNEEEHAPAEARR